MLGIGGRGHQAFAGGMVWCGVHTNQAAWYGVHTNQAASYGMGRGALIAAPRGQPPLGLLHFVQRRQCAA